ncbi:MAG TPA: DUF1080 domain-containing protein, partial [Vicinamibacterales bacterium]|nr:DUF1080 domain-containing protein [Vicinamibacterales bacterium]
LFHSPYRGILQPRPCSGIVGRVAIYSNAAPVGVKRGAAAALTLTLALAAGCGSPSAPTPPAPQGPNRLSPDEISAGWRLLFDGSTTNNWRRYRSGAPVSGWQVMNGELTRVTAGGDIITAEQFADFELVLDWKVPSAGNSGIFIRVTEDHEAMHHGAPEMQILDNAGHPDGRSPLTSAGANYGLYAPERDVSRPAGEWNSARLLVRGTHVEHWLNAVKIVEYEIGSPEWERRVAESQFRNWPAYGKARQGHIGLQDHGDRVAFRNIKLRPL